MKNKINKEKEKGRWMGLYFLGLVIILYLFIFCLNFENAYNSLKASGDILVKLIPVLVLVVFLMGLLNYFLKPKTLSKYLGKGSGIRGWILAVLAGIISHGPIYVLYPLLKELRKQGMRQGLVAVFLYNRAIKNSSLASDYLSFWNCICCHITYFHGNSVLYRGKNYQDVGKLDLQYCISFDRPS